MGGSSTSEPLGCWSAVWVAVTHASGFNHLLDQARLGHGDGVVLGIHIKLDSKVLSKVTILGQFESNLVQPLHKIVNVLLVGGSLSAIMNMQEDNHVGLKP